jgi:hypothetical protein
MKHKYQQKIETREDKLNKFHEKDQSSGLNQSLINFKHQFRLNYWAGSIQTILYFEIKFRSKMTKPQCMNMNSHKNRYCSFRHTNHFRSERNSTTRKKHIS